jgi:hypothetical protein
VSMSSSFRGRKGPPPQDADRPESFLSRRKSGLGAAGVLIAAVAAGGWIWSVYGPKVRSGGGYALSHESIELVGLPEWVPIDLEREVLRSASLDGPLAVDDPGLAVRIARGFAMHPWVKEVIGVELLSPPAARVEIVCREPVAMVRVDGGVLPVDGEGVVLPSDGFTPESASSYPKVLGIGSSPQGPAGTPWGDEAVEEAASLAALIRPEWRALGGVQIQGKAREGTETGRSWTLVREDGGEIRFGSAPGRERPGEPPAAAKLARLRRAPAGEDVDLTIVEEVDPPSAAGKPGPDSPGAPTPEAAPAPVPLEAPAPESPGTGDGPPSGTTRREPSRTS